METERFSSVLVGGERYGSSTSRTVRSSYIIASWVSDGGRIDINSAQPRPGKVSFYIRQNVLVDGSIGRICLLMFCGINPIQIGITLGSLCKSAAKIFLNNWGRPLIPVQRIQSKFVLCLTKSKEKTLLSCVQLVEK